MKFRVINELIYIFSLILHSQYFAKISLKNDYQRNTRRNY